ncbi:YhfC family glutamic-type intramembrane protease [uncultured Clostridium sp.]|uniref:YhfC family glutamic-type intramembrane protease n=1 Tax=uncultured Clostridium sp. TaxID=59620 RepID=UPI00262E7DD3|nr:YhfC family glutamic-type intramembrane protease [uncultured Clostridium sp.]
MVGVMLVLNIAICFGIPIGYVVITRKRGYSLKPFFIGIITFVVSQLFLRIPIMNAVLGKSLMSFTNPILFLAILSFSAGIFEETGRRIFIGTTLKRNRSFRDGISFGVGHAGIEAIIFVGLNSLISLYGVITANLGITGQLTSLNVFFATVERVFAGGLHIALTLLILYGINRKLKYTLPLAIIIHGIANFGAVLMMPNVLLAEGWLFIIFIIAVVYITKVKKKFKEDVEEKEEAVIMKY